MQLLVTDVRTVNCEIAWSDVLLQSAGRVLHLPRPVSLQETQCQAV